MLSITLILPAIALASLWQHFKLYYLRMRWLKIVDTTAKIYKDVSSAILEINESGVGLKYNSDYEFLYWESVKEFNVFYNKFLLIYSGPNEYIFVPLKGLADQDIDKVTNALKSKHIYQKLQADN